MRASGRAGRTEQVNIKILVCPYLLPLPILTMLPCNFVPTYLAAKSAEKCECREEMKRKEKKKLCERRRDTHTYSSARGVELPPPPSSPLVECGKLNARCNTILPSSSLMRRNAQTTSARPESIDNTVIYIYIYIISERDELCENFPHVLSECIPSGEKFLHKLREYERRTGRPLWRTSRDRLRNLEIVIIGNIILSRFCDCLGIVTYCPFHS